MVSGGRNSQDRFLDDLHLLYLGSLTWAKVQTQGATIPRAMHQVDRSDQSFCIQSVLYCFGGYNSLGFVSSIMNQYELILEEREEAAEVEKPKIRLSKFG